MAGTRFSRGFQRMNPQPPAFFFKRVDRCGHLFYFIPAFRLAASLSRALDHVDSTLRLRAIALALRGEGSVESTLVLSGPAYATGLRSTPTLSSSMPITSP